MVVETMRSVQEPALRPTRSRSLNAYARSSAGGSSGSATESRSILTVAAVIGREFEFELLHRTAGLDEDTTAAAVEELVRRSSLHRRGRAPRLHARSDPRSRVCSGSRVAPQASASPGGGDHRSALCPIASRTSGKCSPITSSALRRGRRRPAITSTSPSAPGIATPTPSPEHACRQAVEAARKPRSRGDRLRALELLGDILSLGATSTAPTGYQAALDATPMRPVGDGSPASSTVRDSPAAPAPGSSSTSTGSGEETLLLHESDRVWPGDLPARAGAACARNSGSSRWTPVARAAPIRTPGFGTAAHAADVRAVIEAAGVGPVTAIGISKSSSILVRVR